MTKLKGCLQLAIVIRAAQLIKILANPNLVKCNIQIAEAAIFLMKVKMCDITAL